MKSKFPSAEYHEAAGWLCEECNDEKQPSQEEYISIAVLTLADIDRLLNSPIHRLFRKDAV